MYMKVTKLVDKKLVMSHNLSHSRELLCYKVALLLQYKSNSGWLL